MSKMTQQEFEQHIDSYMKMDIAIRNVAEEYANKFEGGGYIDSIEVDYDGFFGTVEVTGEIPSHCGCCSGDYMNFTFPLRYVYEDDWAEQVQTARDRNKRKEEELEKQEAEEQKKKEAAAERRLYEQLKEKYE